MNDENVTIELRCTCGTTMRAHHMSSFDAEKAMKEFHYAHLICSVKKALETTENHEER